MSSKGADLRPEILDRTQALLADAKEQLASTPHFGVLAPVLESKSSFTTRLDYVERLCVLLHQLKTAAPGLGLGSPPTFPRNGDQNPWRQVQGMSGLEICQAWSVLLNAGHLFGTFSTERPVLFALDRSLALRDEFLAAVATNDFDSGGLLRTAVQTALDKAQLHSFHELLALWRLREGGVSGLTGAQLHLARLLVRAFVLPPNEKLRELRSLFTRVRTLAFLQIHATLDVVPHQIRELENVDWSALFPDDALPDADWMASSRWAVYTSIAEADSESLFGSSSAAIRILGHVGAFDRWWKGRSASAGSELLDELFRKPHDWPPEDQRVLSHFIELRVPSTLGWLHEVRHWLHDDGAENPWGSGNFFITPARSEDLLRVDIYEPEHGIADRTLEHVVHQLSRPFSGRSSVRHDHALWMSTARLLARMFKSQLKENYNLRLSPVHATSGHSGYAVAGSTYEMVRGRTKAFIPLATDEQRAIELRQLLAIADEVVGWRDPTVLMLAKAEVVGPTNGRLDVATDIDGLIGYFRDEVLTWLVVETKRAGAGRGDDQLRRQLFPTLRHQPNIDIEFRSFAGANTWFITFGHQPK